MNHCHLIRWSHIHWTQEQGKRSTQRRKIVVSIGKMTHQTHLRAMILIPPMTVIIAVNDANIRNIRKISNQTMRNFNGKIADNSV